MATVKKAHANLMAPRMPFCVPSHAKPDFGSAQTSNRSAWNSATGRALPGEGRGSVALGGGREPTVCCSSCTRRRGMEVGSPGAREGSGVGAGVKLSGPYERSPAPPRLAGGAVTALSSLF